MAETTVAKTATSLALAAALAFGCTASTDGYIGSAPALGEMEVTSLRLQAGDAEDAGQPSHELWRRLLRAGHADYHTCWRGARANCRAIQALAEDDEGREPLAREAVAWASRAVELRTEGVEGRFAYALALGLLAEADSLAVNPRDVLGAALAVVALNPAYEEAGGHRMAGLYYLRAPDLYGGDLDLALEHLEKATARAPACAENHVARAEALLVDDNPDAATIELGIAGALEPDARVAAWISELRAQLE